MLLAFVLTVSAANGRWGWSCGYWGSCGGWGVRHPAGDEVTGWCSASQGQVVVVGMGCCGLHVFLPDNPKIITMTQPETKDRKVSNSTAQQGSNSSYKGKTKENIAVGASLCLRAQLTIKVPSEGFVRRRLDDQLEKREWDMTNGFYRLAGSVECNGRMRDQR